MLCAAQQPDKPFKTKELSSQINSARLSFASAEAMEEYLDILPGSVSVMGHGRLFFCHMSSIQFVMGHRQEYLLYMTSYHYKQYII